MSVFKRTNLHTISPLTGSKKAPVPQVDREHLGEMRKIEKDAHHVEKQK